MTTHTQPKPRARRRKRAPRSLANLIDDVVRRAAADLDHEEAVHDLRVACRRLEAGTRINDGVLSPRRMRATRRAAKQIRRAFDQARDLEVIAAEIRDVPGLSDAFRADVRESARHRDASTQASGRIGDALADLRDARTKLAADDVPERDALALALRDHIAAFFDEFGRLLPESTDDAVHRLRIAAKKLRYEMEIARPVFSKLTAQVTRMKRLQDIIGRHQDAAVGLAWAEHLTDGEHAATADDRATLMRSYAALHRQQRSALRRLHSGWQARDIRQRFFNALG